MITFLEYWGDGNKDECSSQNLLEGKYFITVIYALYPKDCFVTAIFYLKKTLKKFIITLYQILKSKWIVLHYLGLPIHKKVWYYAVELFK